jgi:hypothetical protein
MRRNNCSTNRKDKEDNNNDIVFSTFLSLLTDRQRAIFETIRMRLSPKDAILYLQDRGVPLIDLEHYKDKTKSKKLDLERFYYITKTLFEGGILQRIFEMGLDLMLMWINHDNEQDQKKRVVILREIFPFQHYLSACYETVSDIICLSGSVFIEGYYFTN